VLQQIETSWDSDELVISIHYYYHYFPQVMWYAINYILRPDYHTEFLIIE